MHPHRHDRVADVFLRPGSVFQQGGAGLTDEGADGLRQRGLVNAAGQAREIADIDHQHGDQLQIQRHAGGGAGHGAELGRRRGSRLLVEDELVAACGDAVSRPQDRRHRHAPAVEEGPVAAAEVNQVELAAIGLLDHGMAPRDQVIGQNDGILIAPPDPEDRGGVERIPLDSLFCDRLHVLARHSRPPVFLPATGRSYQPITACPGPKTGDWLKPRK